MNNQICTIERGDNGFIVRMSDGDSNITQVYEDKYFNNDLVGDKEAFMESLNALVGDKEAFMESLKETFQRVMYFFGVYNGKQDRKALSVDIVDRVNFPAGNTIADLQRDRDAFMKESIRLQVEIDTLRQPKQSGSNTSGKVTLKIKDDGDY